MISHKWLYLADIFEHQIMLMNNLRNFPPVTLGIFQSTLLQEERLKLKYIQNGNSYFNPRSYKRSDNDFQSRYSWDYDFNPRSYKRSDIVGICLCVGYVVFQSTLLQEERQAWDCISGRGQRISIHAPTRGATIFLTFIIPFLLISIHAPTRGATMVLVSSSESHIFQSTLLQEERLQSKNRFTSFRYFNPRSYKRSDHRTAPVI